MEIPRGAAAPLSPHENGAGCDPARRRIFTGKGRYPGTLQSVTAELNLDGIDYVLVPDSSPPHAPLLGTVQALLAASPTPLTRLELLVRWPGDPPREDSLWRTLTRGCETGMLVRTGSETKTDAFRYALASQTQPPELAAG